MVEITCLGQRKYTTA
jgi:hypothetical protein